ncbi:MAG: EAL domain-containing protein [Desulfobulbaceae bacterium]|nr:EAL domain-containing protein [Desulfobulbaceae bacterium]
MRLHSKIIALTTPVVILCMITVGVVSFTYLRKTIRDSAYGAAQNALEHTESKIVSLYETAETNMRIFASSSVLTNYLLTDNEQERFTLLQPTLIRLFSGYLKANPEYYEIRVIMPDGFEDTRVVLHDFPNITDEEKNSVYFKTMQNSHGEFFTTTYTNPDNDRAAFLIAKKFLLRDPNLDPITSTPSLRGYLAVTVDLQSLAQYLHPSHNQYGINFLITNRRGKVLFNSLPGKDLISIPNRLLEQVADHTHMEKPFITQYDQLSHHIFSKTIHGEFIILAMIPEKDLFASSHHLGLLIALITLLFSVAFSSLLIFLGRKFIVSPIMELRNAASEMGEGNPDIELLLSNDELGELGHSLIEMNRQLHESQAQIRHLAYHDSLTGLPNRIMLQEFLKRALAGAQRHKELLAVLFVDLDDFKRINDTLGHKTGDDLLKKLAARIETAVRHTPLISHSNLNRESDQVARIGGDEFIIVLPCIERHSDAAQVARRLLEALSQPFHLDEHQIHVTVSIGISIFPADTDLPDELIRLADIAMYHAKEKGKNNYRYYSSAMNTHAVKRQFMEMELRRALEHKEFVLKYQPQVDPCSGQVRGLEALIRWQHPKRGIILPDEFMALAEESELIIPIGEWVVNTVIAQHRVWLDRRTVFLPISINLSTIQLLDANFEKILRRIIAHFNIPASLLQIEITENALIKAGDNARRSLFSLRETGIRICLDDFGSGYSSLTNLTNFPIDKLIIDRGLITNVVSDTKDGELVSAIIKAAKTLGLTVTAKGVEHRDQLEFLKDRGCDLIQGFYFYRPLFASEVEELATG